MSLFEDLHELTTLLGEDTSTSLVKKPLGNFDHEVQGFNDLKKVSKDPFAHALQAYRVARVAGARAFTLDPKHPEYKKYADAAKEFHRKADGYKSQYQKGSEINHNTTNLTKYHDPFEIAHSAAHNLGLGGDHPDLINKSREVEPSERRLHTADKNPGLATIFHARSGHPEKAAEIHGTQHLKPIADPEAKKPLLYQIHGIPEDPHAGEVGQSLFRSWKKQAADSGDKSEPEFWGGKPKPASSAEVTPRRSNPDATTASVMRKPSPAWRK